MPISKSNHVFKLVKSLSKAEKRNFRLFATRIQNRDELLFLRLFDLIDKQKSIDDELLIKQLGNIGKSSYSNLKRHLYAQIISSLRIVHKEKRANFKVREYLDYAYILYGKGLYLQALKILRLAKNKAIQHHLPYMQLILIEFEKIIESRHITRSGPSEASALIEQSSTLQNKVEHLIKLSNLRLLMHGKYLKEGHVGGKLEAQQVRDFYHQQIADIDVTALGAVEFLHYLQSRVWYNYILLDFQSCMKYAIQWVETLQKNPNLIEKDRDLLMRGFHYVLTSANHIKDKSTHKKYLHEFELFRKTNYSKFNTNSQILSFLYVHLARLDNINLNHDFKQADQIIARSLSRIKRYQYRLDDHRVMVFYFKFSWIYLVNGQTSKALHYLNIIVNNKLNRLRVDLQAYAKILHIICHYEIGNYDILPYLIRVYSQYLKSNQQENAFMSLSLNMFKRLESKGLLEHKSIFKEYLTQFEKLNRDPYDRRALSYLDISSWIQSKITGLPISEVLQKQSNKSR